MVPIRARPRGRRGHMTVIRDRFEDMICAIRRYLRRRKGLL